MFGRLYSLLIQMNLPASICDKNGKTSLHFQMAALCGRLTVSEMTTNLLFFFHCLYLSLPLFICSPSVELISVSFFKTLASEGLCGRLCVITGPKCNKGAICNDILNPIIIKILSVIIFGSKCNKGCICKSYLHTQTANIPTTNYGE